MVYISPVGSETSPQFGHSPRVDGPNETAQDIALGQQISDLSAKRATFISHAARTAALKQTRTLVVEASL